MDIETEVSASITSLTIGLLSILIALRAARQNVVYI